MDLLLDTHTLIWFFNGDPLLSSAARRVIEDSTSTCWVSITSLWELSIKTSIGKLALRGELAEVEGFIAATGMQLLPISFRSLLHLQILPFHHRDPFDRLLIAQAVTENLTLVSRDAIFPQYDVSVFW
ncbi:MAG: type II toxin-antitoxin system VapC family toxin [Janthinobacterium lividum]